MAALTQYGKKNNEIYNDVRKQVAEYGVALPKEVPAGFYVFGDPNNPNNEYSPEEAAALLKSLENNVPTQSPPSAATAPAAAAAAPADNTTLADKSGGGLFDTFRRINNDGLLKTLENSEFDLSPTTMGLLQAAGQMFERSNNQSAPVNLGNVLGAGLTGFTKGLSDEKNRLRVAKGAADPYYTIVNTTDGPQAFNARDGSMNPLINKYGKPFVIPQYDPNTQGLIQLSKEMNTMYDVKLADGTTTRMLGSKLMSLMQKDLNSVKGYSVVDTTANNGGSPTANNGGPVLANYATESKAEVNKQTALSDAQKQQEARLNLPGLIDDTNKQIKDIDELLDHPGLPNVVGVGVPGLSLIPGTDWADFRAMLEHLTSEQFMSGYQALKGAGAITEVEAKAAQKAISGMNISTSEKEFKKAAQAYKDLLYKAVKRMANKASGIFEPGELNPNNETPSATPDETGPSLVNKYLKKNNQQR